MTQYLEAKIPIPDDYVIITKIEYEELRKEDSIGDTLTLGEVADRLNRSKKWVVDEVLRNPKFKRHLDIRSGGFVHYEQGGGDKYIFLKSKTLEFLENNFADILG